MQKKWLNYLKSDRSQTVTRSSLWLESLGFDFKQIQSIAGNVPEECRNLSRNQCLNQLKK